MPSIIIQPFTGLLPKISALLLPATGAQIANNVKMMSGEIRAWKKPMPVADKVVANATSIHRLYGVGGGSKFLSWAADVNVVGSPMSDASDYRAYYAGDTTPRKANWALAIQGAGPYPYDYLEMGVPAPSAAPTLTVVNGTGTAEDRVYLQTFVSTFGSLKEESAPCAPVTCTIQPTGGSVTINAFAAPPAGKYNITHRRIYRSLAGTSDYGFVAEIPVATTSYSDAAATGSATSLLQSLYWTPPPSGLKGIVSMPNGMVAGFNGNEVWFCEPYYPHAWPSSYMLTVDYPIVGLGVYGSVLVVLTERIPYLISGSHPSAMSQEALQMPEPCIAKRSIAHNEFGVLYVSPNGIVGIGQGTRGLVTEDAYTRDDWQATSPTGLFGALFGRNYMLFNSNQVASERTALVFPIGGSGQGVSFMNSPSRAFHIDRKTGELFSVSEIDGLLYQLDCDPVNLSTFTWKSKKFDVPQPVNFTCFQVDADYSYLNDSSSAAAVAQVIAFNQAIWAGSSVNAGAVNGIQMNGYSLNGSAMKNVPTAADLRSITASIFAEGSLVTSMTVSDHDPIRLPDGFKAYEWEIELSGNAPIHSVGMATSIAELKSI